jgi:hypothetical protein
MYGHFDRHMLSLRKIQMDAKERDFERDTRKGLKKSLLLYAYAHNLG